MRSRSLSPGNLLHRSYRSRPAIKRGRSWALFICITTSRTDCSAYVVIRPDRKTVQFVNRLLDDTLTETLVA
jgi:hypothetical protein